MLELKNINKNYNPGTVNELCLFENFNLTIQDGEFLSVVGSNGSGKTYAQYHLRNDPGGFRFDFSQWNRHRQSERLYPSQKDRKSVSGSIQRNLSKHDHP